MAGIVKQKKLIPAIMSPSLFFMATPPERQSFTSLRINRITRTRSRHVAPCLADRIVFQAYELHQVEVWTHQLRCKLQMNRFRKGTRIIKREIVDERSIVDPGPSFDRVEFLRVRGAAAVEPELVVIANGVDDERVALPRPNRVAPPSRKKIVRMLAAIHVDHAMRAGVPGLVQDVDVRQPLRRVRHCELPGRG